MDARSLKDQKAGIVLLILEVIIICIFAFCTSYGRDADPKSIKPKSAQIAYYGMFQDVHVMMVVGFGFLMAFLRKYGYGSVGFNFLLCAVLMQWGLLSLTAFSGPAITVRNLVKTDILVAAILISFGAVLGKTSPLQIIIMAIIEAPVYALNDYIGEKLSVSDPGGSIFVHTFGAYFGLSVSRILGKPKRSPLECSSYNSDLFSMIGTLFLWVFWPSFNAVLSTGGEQERAVLNTYLSLTASCVTTFALSAITDPNGRLTMTHIQNATLAGGVAVGAIAVHVIQPFGALLIGAVAGLLSTAGYVHLQGWLERRGSLHDTCGVHNLHGLPGILSAIGSAVVAASASTATYGSRLYLVYSARAPLEFSPELKELQQNLIEVLPGENRTAIQQAGYQLLGTGVTLTLAITSGIFTGLFIKVSSRYTGSVSDECVHDDELYWNLPDEEKKTKTLSEIETISNNTLNVG